MTIARRSGPFRRSFSWGSQTFWFVYRNVNDFMSVNGHYLAAAIAFLQLFVDISAVDCVDHLMEVVGWH